MNPIYATGNTEYYYGYENYDYYNQNYGYYNPNYGYSPDYGYYGGYDYCSRAGQLNQYPDGCYNHSYNNYYEGSYYEPKDKFSIYGYTYPGTYPVGATPYSSYYNPQPYSGRYDAWEGSIRIGIGFATGGVSLVEYLF